MRAVSLTISQRVGRMQSSGYSVSETLRNGTIVTIRAARSDDGPKIRRAFQLLGRDTIYSRFFGYRTDLSETELTRLTQLNWDASVTLAVTVGAGEDERIVGGGSYIMLEPGRPEAGAEVAFTVEEDFHGRGVATALLRHLIGIARANGVGRLEADVLARNLPMLSVFRRCGLPVTTRQSGDVVHVTMPVPQLPAVNT